MTMLPIRLSGVVSEYDAPAFDSPPDAWTIAQEVHFRQAAAERVLQARRIYGNTPSNVHPLHMRNSYFDGTNSWIVGTSTQLRCVQPDGTYTVISEVGNEPATTKASDWSSCELNGIPVVNYGGDPVYWLRNPAADSVALPDWPAASTCKVIRAYKNYLIALNVFDGSAYPSLIRWSDAAEPGTVPTSWTPSITTDAGEFSAGGVNEGITDGLALRDNFMVYKPHSTFVMQYVGGNAIMAIRLLSDTMGCLSTNCVAELNGNHIVLGQGDVYITDGQSIKSLVSQIVRVDLFRRMDPEFFTESYVVSYPTQNEVWICIPEVGERYATLALVWHASTGKFSYRNIKYGNAAIGGCPHIAFGNIGEILTGEVNWDDRTTNWNTDTTNWNTFASIPAVNGLVAARLQESSGSCLLELDAAAGTETSLSLRPVVLYKAMLDFGEHDSVKHINELWPRITGIAGTLLSVQFGMQMESDDEVSFGPSFDYVIGTTKKIDCRLSGRFLSFLISSADLGVWRLTGMDVNVIKTSRY
jgi:hypothetical protein